MRWPGQGVDPKSIKLDWEKVRASQKDRAERDVKASLLLDKIGEREAIGATQEEVDREVQRIARQQREAVAVTRAKLQKEGAIAALPGTSAPRKRSTCCSSKLGKKPSRPKPRPSFR